MFFSLFIFRNAASNGDSNEATLSFVSVCLFSYGISIPGGAISSTSHEDCTQLAKFLVRIYNYIFKNYLRVEYSVIYIDVYI